MGRETQLFVNGLLFTFIVVILYSLVSCQWWSVLKTDIYHHRLWTQWSIDSHCWGWDYQYLAFFSPYKHISYSGATEDQDEPTLPDHYYFSIALLTTIITDATEVLTLKVIHSHSSTIHFGWCQSPPHDDLCYVVDASRSRASLYQSIPRLTHNSFILWLYIHIPPSTQLVFVFLWQWLVSSWESSWGFCGVQLTDYLQPIFFSNLMDELVNLLLRCW